MKEKKKGTSKDKGPSNPGRPATDPWAGTFVASALRDARVGARDARGLMPIDEARAIVRATVAFRKGEGEMIDGTFVLDSDRAWAALLSLEDAAEFVLHAKRISWEFHVRGRDNTAPLQRYGEGIVSWLESRLDAKGVLFNIPWCIVPCLLAMDAAWALEIALKTTAVHELLPDQAPLGAGVGVFAATDSRPPPSGSRPPPPRAWLRPTEGLDLARAWMARHGDQYGTLARLADGGDLRAQALLRDRAQALGDAVHDALEAALGKEEAARVAARFELPKSALAPEVHRVLEEAESISEPRGPLWSIAELDEAARDYDLPLWDNANYTTGAMRVSGFASRHGDAFVVESIVTNPGASEIVAWEMRAYGPGAKKRGAAELLVDEKKDELGRIELGGSDFVDGVSGHIHTWEDDEERIVPLAMPHDYVMLTLQRALLGMAGKDVHTQPWLPRSFAALPEDARAKLREVSTDEALLVSLCAEHAGDMFAHDVYLSEAAGFSKDAVKLFSFDRFQWVAAGDAASSSPDIVAMIEALRRRKRITRLPGVPSSTPEHWLPACAELRSYAGGDAWSVEEDPWGPERPATGPGSSPYWNMMLARGWPHGVSLMHGPAHNQRGQAEQTIPYLVAQPAAVMQVFWPRRAACLFARVCAGAKDAWDSKDPGVVAAMKEDAMLHLAEAREIAGAFVKRAWDPPAHVGAELVGILEALVGPSETVRMFADALAKPAAWEKDRPALAAAVFELGFVLRRTRSKEARAALAPLFDASRTTDVARALDLVLHDNAGAERSARAQLDYAHVSDLAWARGRVLDAKTARSPFDPVLVPIAGDALIEQLRGELAAHPNPIRLANQLTAVGGARAVDALLELWTLRSEARPYVINATLARASAKSELEAALSGALGDAARAVLLELEGREKAARDEDGDEDDGDEEEDEED